MKTYHILYTDIDGVFQEVLKEFSSLFWCETWLKSIGAKYWEIG